MIVLLQLWLSSYVARLSKPGFIPLYLWLHFITIIIITKVKIILTLHKKLQGHFIHSL